MLLKKTHFEWWVFEPLSIKYERILLLFEIQFPYGGETKTVH